MVSHLGSNFYPVIKSLSYRRDGEGENKMVEVGKWEAIEYLREFIPKNELELVIDYTKGKEDGFFVEKLLELYILILTMPKTYEQDGKGDEAIAYLHYFKGGSDWFITEKDINTDKEGQVQAFGYTILNGDKEMAEMGYISIKELIENNVELDLYWTPKTLKEVKEVK